MASRRCAKRRRPNEREQPTEGGKAMTRAWKLTAFAVLAILPALLLAQAASAESTLDRILREKKIRITAEVTSPPFGILDKDGQPDGSEIATARQLAKDLGVELELVQV